MEYPSPSYIPNIDWNRSPHTQAERKLWTVAYTGALRFFRDMQDVAEEFSSEASRGQLRQTITPLILNAWDGYLSGRNVVVEQDDTTTAFLDELDVDWNFVARAIEALSALGMLHVDQVTDARDPDYAGYQMSVGDQLDDNLSQLKSQALDHSQPLDVHTWSEHPEVDHFVDHIFQTHFGTGNANIRKKHIKVLLLDLYVRWNLDPGLKTGVSRNVNSYDPKSRYNALNISKLTPEIVDILDKAGLVYQASGFPSHDNKQGRTSRVWPTGRLASLFKNAKFGQLDVGYHPHEEVIVLRDAGCEEIPYDDGGGTNRMRFYVRAYNDLLRRTFIDIPTLKDNYIDLGSGAGGNPRRLQIGQQDKFTRRIFNRGSFDKGGRFWGGWWQRCPKEWREHIFIDGSPTIEVDYSAHHIAMLYQSEGIDYWSGGDGDPYKLDLAELDGTPEEQRDICKALTLVALNARNDKEAFSAFRYRADTGSREKRMTDGQLRLILDALREKHSRIAHKFASDAGIDLMSKDAKITERLISHFTRKGIPILTIHDSFIAPIGAATELATQMQKAYASVMGASKAKMKQVWSKGWRVIPTRRETQRIGRLHVLRSNADRFDSPMTDRYVHNHDRFKEWLRAQERGVVAT